MGYHEFSFGIPKRNWQVSYVRTYIFPRKKIHHMRTRILMHKSNINQNNLLQEKKSSGTSAIPRKKIANRQTLIFINSSMEKMIQVCNQFCIFLYSRLPPQQYMTRVDKRDRLLKSCPGQAAVDPWGSRGLRRIMRWKKDDLPHCSLDLVLLGKDERTSYRGTV